MTLRELIEARASLWEKIKGHLDTAAAEGRSETVEAEETYKRMHGDMAQLDARIAEAVELDKRNAQADEIRAKYAPVAEQKAAPLDDNAILRKMIAGEMRGFDFTGEKRDLSKGSAGAGLNTVPTSFWGMLHEHLIENSAIRQTNVSVITTGSGEDLQVPKTTSHSSAALIAEGAAITESDPVFGQITMKAYKYALTIQVSSELEQDTGVDLMGYLAKQAGRALANASGAHFVTGDNSSKPQGIATAASAGITGAATVFVPTADDLLGLYYSVIDPYRRNGYWLMADAAALAIRKLKDSDGQYIWRPGLDAGEPNTLLARPLVIDTNVADPAADAKCVLFGDMSSYLIRDVAGVRAERSVDFAFNTDLVTWRFLLRTDGRQVDTTGAVKAYVSGAAS